MRASKAGWAAASRSAVSLSKCVQTCKIACVIQRHLCDRVVHLEVAGAGSERHVRSDVLDQAMMSSRGVNIQNLSLAQTMSTLM